jgi:O-antigen ligase
MLLVIALQLIPLPPQTWTALPGRETAAAAAALGGPVGWRPISLDPEATRRTAAALLLPAGLLLATLTTDNRGLLMLARAIVLGALLSALLGAVQISVGTPASLSPYGDPAPGVATGFFANRNHQAQLMLLGLVATSLLIRVEPPQVRLPRRGRDFRIHLGWLLFPMFIALAAATQSRAGLMLTIPALAAALVIALNPRGTARGFGLALAGIALAVGFLASSENALTRLATLQSLLITEGRVISLPDIMYTLNQYWPLGSGFGTFVPVFRANENLDLVGPTYLNHAHNDALELLIEAGLAGALLLALATLLLAMRLVHFMRRSNRARGTAPALAGTAMLVLLILHSLIDYPLRTDALAAVAAVALGFLFSPAQSADASSAQGTSRRRRRKGFADPNAGFGSPSLRSHEETAQ